MNSSLILLFSVNSHKKCQLFLPDFLTLFPVRTPPLTKCTTFSHFLPWKPSSKHPFDESYPHFHSRVFVGKGGLIHQVIHIIHIFYPQFGGLHRFPPKQMFCLFIIIAFFRRFFVQKSLFHSL